MREIDDLVAVVMVTASGEIKTVVYVTDMGDAQKVARAHGERFRDILPASTLVEVSKLLEPRMKVEIEAYAVLEA